MKKLFLILATSFLAVLFTTSCTKDKAIAPAPTPTVDVYTVVCTQTSNTPVTSYSLGVHRANPSDGINGFILIPTFVSSNIYDSIPIPLVSSGDKINMGAWKSNDESIATNPILLPNYTVRVKLYHNNILLHDTISNNGQYGFTLP